MKYSDAIRHILAQAREEAIELRHDYIGTEHILLALLAEGEGRGMEVLKSLGGDPVLIRDRIEESVRRGSNLPLSSRRAAEQARIRPGELPYTSRGKTVITSTAQLADSLHQTCVDSEHLLLALLAEGKGIAAVVLNSFGITLENALSEVVRMMPEEEMP